MKCVLALHPAHSGNPAINLLTGVTSWGWSNLAVDVLCVVEPVNVGVPSALGLDPAIPVDVLRTIEQAAEDTATEGANTLTKAGFNAQPVTSLGNPESEIIERARITAADLIITGSERKGAFASLFFGSVTRALALQSQSSVLIMKDTLPDDGLNLVFATDFSDYSTRAWQKLIAWAPQKVRRITLTTCIEPPNTNFGPVFPNLAPFLLAPPVQEQIVRERLEAFSQAMPWNGVDVRCAIAHGSPMGEIEALAEREQADAVVLGAQGHTVLDRVVIGSVALHHVMHGQKPLLLIRP